MRGLQTCVHKQQRGERTPTEHHAGARGLPRHARKRAFKPVTRAQARRPAPAQAGAPVSGQGPCAHQRAMAPTGWRPRRLAELPERSKSSGPRHARPPPGGRRLLRHSGPVALWTVPCRLRAPAPCPTHVDMRSALFSHIFVRRAWRWRMRACWKWECKQTDASLATHRVTQRDGVPSLTFETLPIHRDATASRMSSAFWRTRPRAAAPCTVYRGAQAIQRCSIERAGDTRLAGHAYRADAEERPWAAARVCEFAFESGELASRRALASSSGGPAPAERRDCRSSCV